MNVFQWYRSSDGIRLSAAVRSVVVSFSGITQVCVSLCGGV